ncbi:MAG: exopolygalacturonase [Prevotella sp.]|nr:exopolygalacturonase [Prevotella sp.]
MRKTILFLMLLLTVAGYAKSKKKVVVERWPDGTVMDAWFKDTTKVDMNALGRQYVITDYGVKNDSSLVQTTAIQAIIDRAAQEGGGVIVVPQGTFLTGALFFKQGTHLYVQGRLKGSDRIVDYPVVMTRIEGQTCKYFPALVNADGVDGLTIGGHGTIDGNGLNYWREFWLRRSWNPKCTNKDAQRPRLTYISNSKNVTIQDVRLINSPFWTNHVYKSSHVRYLDCYIYAPTEKVWDLDPKRGAPSSDAIDIDVCTDILINGCYMHVNDDAVVLKGGKGTWADKDETNGPCERILVQNCRYGRVHGCLTLGSESLHDRNIILRNCSAENTDRVLWLKMRPDTPQHYEYVLVESFTGKCTRFLFIHPWTQFYEMGDRPDMPLSACNNIVMRDIRMNCNHFFDVALSDKYTLRDFTFERIDVTDEKDAFDANLIPTSIVKDVVINGVKR